MDYTEVTVTCPESHRDIFVAELAELGFESFVETETGVQAYIQDTQYDAEALQELMAGYADAQPTYTVKSIPQQNWNAEWEKNYEPIRVEDQVLVRANFHPADDTVPYEIEINPKMSFGTGHHSTTYLMLKHMLKLPIAGTRLYDVGTGTGILAIMACKMGATEVEANDVEDWTVENCAENCALNGCDQVKVHLGPLAELDPQGPYDIMLANINRNVLLDEIGLYSQLLKAGGHLLLSGFYEADVPMLSEAAAAVGLEVQGQDVRQEWTCLHLIKNA